MDRQHKTYLRTQRAVERRFKKYLLKKDKNLLFVTNPNRRNIGKTCALVNIAAKYPNVVFLIKNESQRALIQQNWRRFAVQNKNSSFEEIVFLMTGDLVCIHRLYFLIENRKLKDSIFLIDEGTFPNYWITELGERFKILAYVEE